MNLNSSACLWIWQMYACVNTWECRQVYRSMNKAAKQYKCTIYMMCRGVNLQHSATQISFAHGGRKGQAHALGLLPPPLTCL